MAIDIFKTKGEDPGIEEGDYNSWAWKWSARPASGIGSDVSSDALIDEKNGVINLAFRDTVSAWRFGVYNINDFSVVFESPAGSSYTYLHPTNTYKRGYNQCFASLQYGGLSRSLQTYLLLMRADRDTIEVWRGGSALVWSRSMALDFTRAVWVSTGSISLTGKYVLMAVQDKASPYYVWLMLYEGFKI